MQLSGDIILHAHTWDDRSATHGRIKQRLPGKLMSVSHKVQQAHKGSAHLVKGCRDDAAGVHHNVRQWRQRLLRLHGVGPGPGRETILHNTSQRSDCFGASRWACADAYC